MTLCRGSAQPVSTATIKIPHVTGPVSKPAQTYSQNQVKIRWIKQKKCFFVVKLHKIIHFKDCNEELILEGKNEGENIMSVNNNAHRHTLSFTLLLIPLRHKWHHSVWWQRTTVPAMKASQSGRRSKKQVHTGAFCLLFACITWPRFCVMFTLKDKTWGSFMKSDLCPTFFFFWR